MTLPGLNTFAKAELNFEKQLGTMNIFDSTRILTTNISLKLETDAPLIF